MTRVRISQIMSNQTASVLKTFYRSFLKKYRRRVRNDDIKVSRSGLGCPQILLHTWELADLEMTSLPSLKSDLGTT